jgi:hypothetical protein
MQYHELYEAESTKKSQFELQLQEERALKANTFCVSCCLVLVLLRAGLLSVL